MTFKNPGVPDGPATKKLRTPLAGSYVTAETKELLISCINTPPMLTVVVVASVDAAVHTAVLVWLVVVPVSWVDTTVVVCAVVVLVVDARRIEFTAERMSILHPLRTVLSKA